MKKRKSEKCYYCWGDDFQQLYVKANTINQARRIFDISWPQNANKKVNICKTWVIV